VEVVKMNVKSGYYAPADTTASIVDASDGTHITFNNKKPKANIFTKILKIVFNWLKKGD